MKWPTAIDLFSGAGGLTCGLRKARYRVVAAVESSALAASSYRLNFPSVRVLEKDIRTLDPKQVMRALGLREGELGLLAGCPPCQGFSEVRTKRGSTVRDPRNRLLVDFIRFVGVMRPRTVLMENVPGVVAYGLFGKLVTRLRKMGYVVKWEVHNAADFGVPQRRHRLMLAASRVGEPGLPSPTAQPSTVWDAIEHLPIPGRSGDSLHDIEENRTRRIMSIIRSIPPDGGSRSDLGEEQQLACHRRTNGFHDIYGRMSWHSVAPTITGGCINPSKGRFLHPDQNRAITVREALLLQAFPPDYRLSLDRGKYAAAQMVGNAIPPLMVKSHALALRQLASMTPDPT